MCISITITAIYRFYHQKCLIQNPHISCYEMDVIQEKIGISCHWLCQLRFSASCWIQHLYHVIALSIVPPAGLARDDLVALALLLGCDYCPRGVPGVGTKIAMQLLRAWKRHGRSNSILDRFRTWKSKEFGEGVPGI